MTTPLRSLLLLAAACLASACGLSSPWASPPPPPPPPVLAEPEFSEERAWQHLEALAAIGPRVAGTQGADAARDYLRAALEELAIEVREHVYEVGAPGEATGASADTAAPGSAVATEAESGRAAGPDARAAAAAGDATAGSPAGPSAPDAEALAVLEGLTPEQRRGLAARYGTPPPAPGDAPVAEAPAPPRRRPGVPPARLVHLTGVIPGESSDIFLLAAHFDTRHFDALRFVGANDGASGPALLLELARGLAGRRPPYTIWLTFLDGEERYAPGAPSHLGSQLLADELAADGTLGRIRLAVFFNQVADADLRIARDLRSHRRYREIFFDVARRLGRGDAFPAGARPESPEGSHLAFFERRLRRVVMIVDDSFGGDEPPGLYWHTEDDTVERCSAESLGTVGVVTLAALDEIGRMLRKIDRFVHRAPPAPAEGAVEKDAAAPGGSPAADEASEAQEVGERP